MNENIVSRSKRRAVAFIAMITGLVVSHSFFGAYIVRYLLPVRREARFRQVLISSTRKLPAGESLVFQDLKGGSVILANTHDGIKAISTTCTHLGCQVRWESAKNLFVCPCHNAYFATDGTVVSGPAPRPLERFDVILDNDNIFVMLKEA